MNTLSKKNYFDSGTIIKGKWNNKKYKIIEAIGSGENGTVYLVQSEGKNYALKISQSYLSLNYEIDIMEKLNRVQGTNLGLKLFDIDDFVYNGYTYFFYIMPYEEGLSIKNYLDGKTAKEYLFIFKKLIRLLSLFHYNGWIFGDIKPEHILINQNTKKITLIDYGGVTKLNEGVKQFTEIYDRGNWKMNNRKADAHYDLFSLSMVFVQISLGINEFQKIYNQNRRISKVCDIIQNIESLKYLYPIIKGILLGRLNLPNDVLREIDKQNKSVDKKIKNYNWINYLFTTSLFLFIVIVVIFFIIEW